ncbi:MAG: hypothetical protein EPO51_27160 [Phenylobacterium sp.]|uniref:hypothetical protein n=1 Tax=Phenylobacterium sp. TaxID=1871053 RepID=UPI001217E3FB|nr:hypothetical protein [Phenylobacterium sp.]TAJ68561.1 MAG: hypothetical protein EPO51_27160 [Phenylobacterium sp.]
MTLPTDEFTPETPSGDLVHWMEPGRAQLGVAGVSTAAVAVFALGVVAAFGALAAFRWLAPRRDGLPPWKWRRGALH